MCFTKDMISREGNIDIWYLLGQSPDEIHRFTVGRFDPSNPRHLVVLDQLFITDQDLSEVDSQS